MHGRVKVRTSEEEKARKEKERQEKLKIYKHAMLKIFSKSNNDEFDEELLNLIGKVLQSNPDIYTLWNIRRKILTLLQKPEKTDDELSKMYDDELSLTEYCLKINPKSYCAWHQREWVLLTRPDPDWKKELALCNIYLKLDERNFHTWDYRRFVVSNCKEPLSNEFNYTTEKLLDNFSNYSAWHYRSKMLVELYPDLEGGRPIEDSHHKQELKMVLSAAFTDPDDTSAWFYQRWLLGAVKDTTQLVACTITKSKTTFAFNKSVPEDILQSIKLLINEVLVAGRWISCTGNKHDCLWIYQHEFEVKDGLDVKIEYDFAEDKQTLNCIEHDPSVYVGKNKIDFQMKYSQPVIDELNNQLGSCRQLLDLEPDSKWTLLTTTVFLHCIDAKANHKEALTNLYKLKLVDKLRLGYYSDLSTKWCIEDQLINDYMDRSLDMKVKFDEKLTCLPHLQYYSYCMSVDLSGQQLTSNVLPSLIVLQNCKKLSLKGNNITTLKSFPKLDLDELNVEGNNLSKEEIEDFKNKYNIHVIC